MYPFGFRNTWVPLVEYGIDVRGLFASGSEGSIRKPYPMEERTGDMDLVLYVAMSLPSDGRGDSDALQCV